MEDANKTMILIGQRIREARLSLKMSQAELAFAANISLPHMSDIELGKKRMMLDTFIRIIEVLKVSSDEILRPNVPKVNEIYTSELSELLEDCTADEAESIIRIVKEIKSSLHSKKDDD